MEQRSPQGVAQETCPPAGGMTLVVTVVDTAGPVSAGPLGPWPSLAG